MDNMPFEDNGELVCHCLGVSEYQIKCAVYKDDLQTVDEVTAATNAGGGCQSCHWRIQELIDEVLELKKAQGK